MKNQHYIRHAQARVFFPLRNKYFHALLTGACVLVFLFVNHAVQASQLHLLLNGKARHINPRPDVAYNERNWGGGFEYDFGRRTSIWVPFVSASGFIDSLENPSYYAGGGILRRYLISRKLDDLHVDLGVIGFVMTRQDFYGGRLFPGALPVLSFGSSKIAMNITYVPAMDKKIAQLWFVQLKVSSKNFWK